MPSLLVAEGKKGCGPPAHAIIQRDFPGGGGVPIAGGDGTVERLTVQAGAQEQKCQREGATSDTDNSG
jgi:hypothetical protein